MVDLLRDLDLKLSFDTRPPLPWLSIKSALLRRLFTENRMMCSAFEFSRVGKVFLVLTNVFEGVD